MENDGMAQLGRPMAPIRRAGLESLSSAGLHRLPPGSFRGEQPPLRSGMENHQSRWIFSASSHVTVQPGGALPGIQLQLLHLENDTETTLPIGEIANRK